MFGVELTLFHHHELTLEHTRCWIPHHTIPYASVAKIYCSNLLWALGMYPHLSRDLVRGMESAWVSIRISLQYTYCKSLLIHWENFQGSMSFTLMGLHNELVIDYSTDGEGDGLPHV